MIKSVRKAMQILQVISEGANRPVSLEKIASATAFPKPTCSHIIETLLEGGYVERVSHSEGYIIGPSMYLLTRHGRYGEELIRLCRPVLLWMERVSGAMVILAVMRGGKKFIIDHADARQGMAPEHSSIREGDIYRTATGRVILSYMDRERLKEVYLQIGAPTQEQWAGVDSLEGLEAALSELKGQTVVATETRLDGISDMGYAVTENASAL